MPLKGLSVQKYEQLLGRPVQRDMSEEDYFYNSDLQDSRIEPTAPRAAGEGEGSRRGSGEGLAFGAADHHLVAPVELRVRLRARLLRRELDALLALREVRDRVCRRVLPSEPSGPLY